MKQPFSEVLKPAFRASIPVLFGYIPLGTAFGVLFSELGYHWLYASLMGLVIFAGAGQFLAVGLLANHAGLAEIFIASLLINIRHLFYGISLLSCLKTRGWRRWYQIFGLTDETFSLLTSINVPDGIAPDRFHLAITALNHGYWILGCTLGAWIGNQISFSTVGIEFTLPALFMVLAIEQYRAIRRPALFVAAVAIGLAVMLLISREHMLLISILMAISLLLMAKGGRPWQRLRTFS